MLTGVVAEIEQKSSGKPQVPLLVDVLGDGTGDFFHMLGLYRKLVSQYGHLYEFIPVISYHFRHTETIQALILKNNLHPSFCFENMESLRYLSSNVLLQQLLGKAGRVFLISNRSFSHLKMFECCINPSALHTFIGEHESGAENIGTRKWEDYSMGLSPGKHGIKIEKPEIPRRSPAEMIAFIQTQDPAFTDALFTYLDVTSAEEAAKRCTLIPAYFSKEEDFKKFLRFIAANKDIPEPVIYLSGIDIKKRGVRNIGEINSINNISIIKPKKISRAAHYNPAVSRRIGIMRRKNFQLSDLSYHALFDAIIVAVSGDNSIEEALSRKSFPFYYSTNSGMKWPFIRDGLCQIIQECSEISDKLRQDYIRYFHAVNTFCLSKESDISLFDGLDFLKMIENWHHVTDKVAKEHNFYDRLESIFLNQHPQHVLEEKETPDVMQFFLYHVAHGNTDEVKKITQNSPKMVAENLNKKEKENALSIAVQFGRKDIVGIFLSFPGFNINTQGGDLLRIAARREDGVMFEYLWQHDARLYQDEMEELFHEVFQSDNINIVRALIGKGLNIDKKIDTYKRGMQYPIQLAIKYKSVDMFSVLLKETRDVILHNVTDESTNVNKQQVHCSLFHLVVASKKPDMLKLLLEKYPKHAARGQLVQINSVFCIVGLIDIHNPNSPTSHLKNFFEKNGFEQNQMYSFTPLQIAIMSGHLEMIKILISAGCPVNSPLDNRFDGLELAKLTCKPEIVQLVSQALDSVPGPSPAESAMHFIQSTSSNEQPYAFFNFIRRLDCEQDYTRAFVEAALPGVFKEIASQGKTEFPDAFCRFATAAHVILSEEKQSENIINYITMQKEFSSLCHPVLLTQLKEAPYLDNYVPFIVKLLPQNICFLFSKNKIPEKLKIALKIIPMVNLEKQHALLKSFLHDNENAALLLSLPVKEQIDLLSAAFKGIQLKETAANDCFKQLKTYLEKASNPKRIFSAAQAIYLLTAEPVDQTQLTALYQSIQADHGRYKLTKSDLATHIGDYLKKASVTAAAHPEKLSSLGKKI